ncbi:MAG: hypothetical protein DI603_16200 [Roseateles depolymerans]|uniref:Uncharacterized protein n=1 Tax=Roseateles depolymerans TaxID=76731 RepID=A0A2W5DLH0_9BURK|nr:MAG: hypothetical protein DI603_16200 [Roseateles depolymerans]
MTAAALIQRRPLPAASTLRRSLLLALLLHLWLVLLFGNLSGAAAPGEGVWGRLTVRLSGPPGAPAPGDAVQAAGGDERPSPPATAVAARAAEAGHAPTAAPQAQGEPEPAAAPQRLPDGFRPVDAAAALPAPASLRPAPAPTAVSGLADPTLAAPLPATVQRLEPAAPGAEPARLKPAAGLSAPAAEPSLPAAWGQDLPAPSQRLDSRDDGLRRLEAPAALRAPSGPVAALPDMQLPTSAVQRLDAPAVASPPPRAADLRRLSQLPASTVPTPDLPASVRTLETATAGAPAATVAPAVAAEPLRLQSATPAAGAALQDLARPLPAGVESARASPVASGAAAPGRVGLDGMALPPGQAASGPAAQARAPLNLNLPRGDLSARRGPGVLELLPPPPERKSKLEKELEGATKVDCRKAYAVNGLLAAVPLAVDAARGKGCQW